MPIRTLSSTGRTLLGELLEEEHKLAEAELQQLGCKKGAWRVFELCSESEAARYVVADGNNVTLKSWIAWRSGDIRSIRVRVIELARRRPEGRPLLFLKVRWDEAVKLLGPPSQTERAAWKRPARVDLARMDEQAKEQLRLKLTTVTAATPSWVAAQRAAVAVGALARLDDPLVIFAAGIFFGTCYANVAGRKLRDDFAKRVVLDKYSEAGRTKHDAEKLQQLHERIRSEHQRLVRDGMAPTKAAWAISATPAIQTPLQQLAEYLGLRPWRGAFYTFPAIRKIVGV